MMPLQIRACLPLTIALLAGALGFVPEAQAEPGEDLTASVITFGPGDHPFLKFGHNAVVIEPKVGPGLVFNFGTFQFDSAALIPKFLRGRFKYWLSVATLPDTIESYSDANRSILIQELDLSAAQKWSLWEALRENARPENREYLYDYFYDNCSTRVRDAIDRVAGGRVRQAGQSPALETFRGHALRSTADLWLLYLGLDVGLGRATDIPINRWDETFLPERLASLLRDVRLPAEAGDKPLVKAERIVHQARRYALPLAPPDWRIQFLGIGVLAGGVLAVLGRVGRRRAWARVFLGVAASAIGFLFGLVGIILLCLWAFTNHRATHSNANILQLAPWAVTLVGYGIGVACRRSRSIGRACWIACAAAAFSVLGLLCKVLPGLNQDNWPLILLCLPIWMGLWLGLRALLRTAPIAARQA